MVARTRKRKVCFRANGKRKCFMARVTKKSRRKSRRTKRRKSKRRASATTMRRTMRRSSRRHRRASFAPQMNVMYDYV